MTKRERAYLMQILDELRLEQKQDQYDLQHALKSYKRYAAGKLTKSAEVIDMLEKLLGEE